MCCKKIAISFLIFTSCVTFSLSSFASAGYIAKDATLKSVANVFGGGDTFIVVATGGTGSCLNQNISFKLDNVFSESVHARAYSTALTAFASDSKVNIWSTDGSCAGATHIQIKK